MLNKKDLDKPLTARDFQEFTDSLDSTISSVVDEQVKKHTDNVLTAVDGVMHEVKAMRQEQSMQAHRNDQIDTRLKKLEAKVA